MVVAVASGKGGTGKTTVAVCLALAAAEKDLSKPLLLDCDVEEPDCSLFFEIAFDSSVDAGVLVPVIDTDRCSLCGRCADICVWNALAVAGDGVLVFRELCHGCGSCGLVCPEKAISESLYPTGKIESGSDGRIILARGVLNVGMAMPVPVISSLLDRYLPDMADRTVIIDSSPGTSCPVVEAVRTSDYTVLVTEPTPFGLHDLRAAVDLVVRRLGLPAGVVINRDGIGNDDVERYCGDIDLPVIGRIPVDRGIAEVLSNGIPLSTAFPEYRRVFSGMLDVIREAVYS